MINKKTVYEVNGKTFEEEADAIKADLVNDYERIANKFLELLNIINNHAKVNIQSELCSAIINVKDKELLDEPFVTKQFASVLRVFLKHLNVSYQSFEGDERKSGYLKIHTDNVVKDIPTVQETITFIKESIVQMEKDFQSYLDSIR